MWKSKCNVWLIAIACQFILTNLFAQAKQTQEHLIWYNAAASEWLQALPIGNGTLGAMIFGGVNEEQLQFNESSLVTGTIKNVGAYQPFGNIWMKFPDLKPVNYKRELDLANGMHRVTFSSAGVDFKREYFASYPDKVIVLHLTASKKNRISFNIVLTDAHAAAVKVSGNKITATGKLSENKMEYESQLLVENTGGSLHSSPEGLEVRNANSVRILLAAGTDFIYNFEQGYKGKHPSQRLDTILKNAGSKPYEQLLDHHQLDYSRLFKQVEIHLGTGSKVSTSERLNAYKRGIKDPGLEALLFQYGRYLLISSSRPGGLPANLQGLWNKDLKPAWYSQYTTNINVQMNYWPAELTGLEECAEPFFDWLENLALVQKKTEDPRLKTKYGWIAYNTNNIMGGGSTWGVHKPGSAWMSRHFFEHYAFTGDLSFLKKRAYPMLKDISEYWTDRLVMNNGKLVTPDGWSPEHGPHKVGNDKTTYPGVSYDQQIVYDLFDNCIAAAATLKVDPEYRTKLTEMRGLLLGPKIGKWGQLQEWMEDWDDSTDRHRHSSNLFAVHPGRQVSPLQTPEYAKAALVSLNARGDLSTGWSTAWKINLFARLGEGDRAYDLVKVLFNTCILENLFDTHPPFQIDGNFGYTAGVAEMLLQSQLRDKGSYIVQLLPALPVAWPEGEVKGLRARGGFIIDMKWKNSKIIGCNIKSLLGNSLKVSYKGKMLQMETQIGSQYDLVEKLYISPD